MTYCFDLDGVICYGLPYEQANPCDYIIKRIRGLKEHGHKVVINTARKMDTYSGNIGLINKNIVRLTLDQLDQWHVPYDEIYFGKPAADFYIDDKAINVKDF